jgi:NitT/TauT family transport system substrate-binding protein
MLAGFDLKAAAAEPQPETTRMRMSYGRVGLCVAPQYVAEELLRGEGFANVGYVRTGKGRQVPRTYQTI